LDDVELISGTTVPCGGSSPPPPRGLWPVAAAPAAAAPAGDAPVDISSSSSSSSDEDEQEPTPPVGLTSLAQGGAADADSKSYEQTELVDSDSAAYENVEEKDVEMPPASSNQAAASGQQASGESPLRFGVSRLSAAIRSGDIEWARQLCDEATPESFAIVEGGQGYGPATVGKTCLHLAAFAKIRDGDVQPLWWQGYYQHLVEKGAHVLDVKDDRGSTALHVAVSQGNLDFAEWLLQAGAGASRGNDRIVDSVDRKL
jgi:hypothetical protein